MCPRLVVLWRQAAQPLRTKAVVVPPQPRGRPIMGKVLRLHQCRRTNVRPPAHFP